MDFNAATKRPRFNAPFNANGGFKKFKPEMETNSTGNMKPCAKFFSTNGCQFGEGCHFLHYVPGGFKPLQPVPNIGGNPAMRPAFGNFPGALPLSDLSPNAVKSRVCNKFNSGGGCKFGNKCHFAHGEWELGRPTGPFYEAQHAMGQRRRGGRMESKGFGAAASFGASATAKVSIDASLSGTIIGKNGVNSKQICRVTGAKLSVRDHETNPNLKNIELEGTFDQIKQASAMVAELTANVGSGCGKSMKNPGFKRTNNMKTKICENFAKNSCTYGEKCNFAHGNEELRDQKN